MTPRVSIFAALSCLIWAPFSSSFGADQKPAVSFTGHVLPLLEAKCHKCHGDKKSPKGGLRLTTPRGIMLGTPDYEVVVPGKPEKSPLYLLTLESEDNDDIMLRYKHYPISNICNENVDRPAHTNACAASMTSECANQQQRFWEINRLIFKNQSNLTAADLRFMAQQVGLDMDAYQACVDNPLTEAAVRADVAHATQVGVTGTPSLFLKGVTGDEWIRVRGGPDELMALIEAHRAGTPFPETPPASRH